MRLAVNNDKDNRAALGEMALFNKCHFRVRLCMFVYSSVLVSVVGMTDGLLVVLDNIPLIIPDIQMLVIQ